ncbi:MAG: HD domain-containing protein, partial [Thermotogaceae bacterium]|nr:HD domain-containing protein [Thermotogaceae bacterium]
LVDQFDLNREIAELSFYVYDVGLIGIRDYILQKNFYELTSEEVEEYKKHPIYGYEILKNIQNLPKEVLDVTLYHHERLDGSGFPHGLKGREVPYIALFIGFIDDIAKKLAMNMSMKDIENEIEKKFPGEFIERLKEVPIGD